MTYEQKIIGLLVILTQFKTLQASYEDEEDAYHARHNDYDHYDYGEHYNRY